jgi:hypothetical protein
MEYAVTLREIEYIPKWNGNRDFTEGQVKVTLRYLNTLQRSTLLPWVSDGKGNMVMRPDNQNLLPAAIVKIENLTQPVGGERKEIKTGRDLLMGWDFDDLVLELTAFVIGMHPREGVEKNS